MPAKAPAVRNTAVQALGHGTQRALFNAADRADNEGCTPELLGHVAASVHWASCPDGAADAAPPWRPARGKSDVACLLLPAFPGSPSSGKSTKGKDKNALASLAALLSTKRSTQ